MSLTPEQLQQRRGKITASIAPEILGLSPYRGPLAAWLRITGRHHEPEHAADDPRRWGHHVERELLRWYAETTICELGYFGSVEHPEHPWMLATPDACVFGEKRIVECKNVGHRMAHHWTDEKAPLYVVVQVLVQIAVCGADACDIVASIGGEAPRIYSIEREDYAEEIAQIVEMLGAFYFAHVETDDPPAPDEQTTARDVQGVFPKHGDEVAPLDDETDLADVTKLLVRYRQLGALEGRVKDARERAKVRLIARIGGRKGIEVPAGETRLRATWSMREQCVIAASVRAAYRHFEVREVKAKKKGGRKAA